MEIRGLHHPPRNPRSKALTVLGAAAGELTRPTSLDKLELDNCIVNPPDTGLLAGPPILPRGDIPPDPPEHCPLTGAAETDLDHHGTDDDAGRHR